MRNIFVLILLLSCAIVIGSANLEPIQDYGIVIGIDLGTTYSCVGVYRAGRVKIITNEQGGRITPSWVGFHSNERLIGSAAHQAFHLAPSQTVFDSKRLIGRRFEDPEVVADRERWPFQLVDNKGWPAIQIEFQGRIQQFAPEEISAMVLGRMKETAEAYLGKQVAHAVITVPAYFNDAQRQATKDAAKIAGLNVLRIINEPTAAAIAYGFDHSTDESRIVVFDLGGGTLDVSLLLIDEGVFEVLATAGDTHLGGEDFDNRVMDHLRWVYEKLTGTDVSRNKRAMAKLKKAAEKAKRTLSSQLTTRVEVESLEGGNDFSWTLTRAKFKELNLSLFEQVLAPIRRVLSDADMNVDLIDHVVLVGGSTRVPKIQELLKKFFHGKELNKDINPDEAVAYGAAIQGSILAGAPTLENIVLVDVCPLTLGIETTGGVFSKLILRNTPIPIRKSEIFSTSSDNQRQVKIQVYEGEQPLTRDNYLLGTFELSGITPSARGVPQIEVYFEIDVNGILRVGAQDKQTGHSNSIIVTNNMARASHSDLERMMRQSEELAKLDEAARSRLTILNGLQSYLSTIKREISGETIAARSREVVNAILSQAIAWVNSDGIIATAEELQQKSSVVENAVRASMYNGDDGDGEEDGSSDALGIFRENKDEL